VNPPGKVTPAPDCIESALDAGCAALITLESICVRPGEGPNEDVRHPLQQAIESLRQAIAELRSASAGTTRRLPDAFVLRPQGSELSAGPR